MKVYLFHRSSLDIGVPRAARGAVDLKGPTQYYLALNNVVRTQEPHSRILL
jgi:hypothetical protein